MAVSFEFQSIAVFHLDTLEVRQNSLTTVVQRMR